MKRILLSIKLIFLVLICRSQPFDQAVGEARLSIQKALDSLKLPGLAIGVYHQGRTWMQGFGYSNLEQGTPVIAPFSRFRIGSISKTLTAAALARLYETGKLDPDAEIHTYCPDFPDKEFPITIRQIAGHLAGIRHYQGLEFLNTKRYRSVGHGLEIFQESPLLFQPGSRYSYSSYGYNLLAAVIENITQVSYLDYMRDSIFLRLEMSATVPDYHEELIPGRVSFYNRQGDQFINSPFVDNSYKWAGGGFLSTVGDLLKFARAHLENTLVKPATLLYFTKTQQTNDGQETGYGMGWRTAEDKFGRHWLGHSGGSVGGTSLMCIYPDQDLIVILLTNISQANIGNLTAEIANVFAMSR